MFRTITLSFFIGAHGMKVQSTLPLDVNQKDEVGKTLLFSAVEQGDYHRASQLVASGADVNIAGPYNETPLFQRIISDR